MLRLFNALDPLLNQAYLLINQYHRDKREKYLLYFVMKIRVHIFTQERHRIKYIINIMLPEPTQAFLLASSFLIYHKLFSVRLNLISA